MERLTRTKNQNVKGAYALTGPDDIKIVNVFRPNDGMEMLCVTGRIVDQLAEYEDALDEGRVIMIPAAWKELQSLQGGEIFAIWQDRVWTGILTDVYISNDGEARMSFGLSEDWSADCKIWDFDILAERYGKYIFKTKEEAETAFEKLKENGNESNRDTL